MRKVLIAVAVIVVLVVGALLILPVFVPTETVKAELIARIEEATGRKARIDGPISVSLIPTAHVSAGGIGLQGLSDEGEAFTVDSISFGVSLIPLLSGTVEVNAVTIERPTVVVAVDAAGNTNWSAAPPPNPDSAPAAIEDLIAGSEADTPVAAATETEAASALDRLSLGRITIKDGTLVYRDATGTEERIEAMNLTVDLPKVAAAGTLEGDFVAYGVTQTIRLAVGERPPATPFERIPVDLSLSAEGAAFGLKGTLLDGDTLFAGTVEASVDSLAEAAGAFGAALPEAPAFGKATASASVTLTHSQARIADFAADLGGAKLTGAAAVAYDRAVPGAAIRLHADRIDTAAFLGAVKAAESGGGGNGAGGGAGGSPIDLSALGLLDANAELSADAVTVGSVTVENLALSVQLADRVMKTTVRSATIAGAPGSGTVTLDGSGATPAIEGAVKLGGLDLAALMALAGTATPLTGLAGGDVSFTTRGATTEALLANLAASGTISLQNGRMTGLGLADTVGDPAADTVEDIDINATFASLAAPVAVDGGLTWRGERFSVAAKADPRALAAGRETDVSLKATSKRVSFGFAGKAGLAGLGAGKVSVSTPSLRELLAWVGHPIGAGGGLAAFSIDGAVNLAKDSASFENAAFTLDQSSGVATGSVAFGAKPAIKAGLAMKTLDITPYLAASGVAPRTAGGGAAPARKAAGGGWSTADIGFSGLSAFDANLNFAADQIVAGDLKIGKSALALTIADGVLKANLSEMALYSGTGSGAISVDGAAKTPSVAAAFKIAGVSALPFLTDLLGFSRVEGTASFNIDLKAAGASPAALTAGLDGEGAMRFTGGAIRGINLPKMVKSLSVETLLGWQPGNDKTEFDDMSGTFTIADGILTNNHLAMAGPLFSLTGAGTVDIPKQTIAYRVEPKVVGSLDGTKTKKLEGFAVPVRIEGAWDNPRIYPEIEGILENPDKALEQLKGLGGGLLGTIGGDKPGKKGKKAKAPAAEAPAEAATPAAEAPAEAATPAAEAPAEAATSAAEPEAAPPAEAEAAPPADEPAPAPAKKPAKKKKAKKPADQSGDLLDQIIGQ